MFKQSSKEIFKILPAMVNAHVNGLGRVSAVELGEQYDINSRTLNITLQKLVHVGILHSQTGGRNPGYEFTCSPQRVSLFEISQVVSHIEYPRCALKEFNHDENCMVCEIITSAVDIIVRDLKAVSCYDFYLSLKEKMKL